MERKGIRLEQWVKRRFPLLSRSQIHESLDRGLVLSDRDKRVAKGLRVHSDDFLKYSDLENHIESLKFGNPELKISVISETEELLVVDKPPGIASHPIGLFDCETITQWALANYPQLRDEFPGIQPALTPHRLDTGTSGILLVAKNFQVFSLWRERFSKKEIEKKYLAWCWGNAGEEVQTVTTPIAHHPSDAGKMVAVAADETYRGPIQKAESHLTILRTINGMSLYEVSCKTGVTHQVRVHLASIGLPLVGDQQYDPQFESRKFRPTFHQLRAVSLTWKNLQFEAPSDEFVSADRFV